MAMANRVQDCETPDNSPSKHLSWTPFAVAMGRTFTSLLLLDNFLSHILSFLPVNLAPGDYKSVNHLEKHSRHPCDQVFCSFVGHLDVLKAYSIVLLLVVLYVVLYVAAENTDQAARTCERFVYSTVKNNRMYGYQTWPPHSFEKLMRLVWALIWEVFLVTRFICLVN